MPITKIEIENLTVFKKMEMNVDAPVNVLIGENGTGKTHLLKFIYMTLFDSISYGMGTIAVNIMGKYSVNLLNSMEVEKAVFNVSFGDRFREYSITGEPKTIGDIEGTFTEWVEIVNSKKLGAIENLIFIPAKDMLTHSKGLPSMKKKYGRSMPFDEITVGIVEKAFQWNLAEAPEFAKEILGKLEKIMDGIVIVENEEFFILRNDGTKISFHVEAEGIKKIGLIWQLLMNDNIKEDTILLWDEPEANVNPNLIPTLAEIILELGRHGVQIFLATHDYFLPKYIEVLSEEKDKVAFHALYKSDNGVQCETDEKFSLLVENAIIDETIKLYEAEIDKGLE